MSRQAERIYALSKKHSLVSGNRKIHPQKKSSNQFVSDQCSEMSNCFVCNEALSLVKENRLVKNKGVQTLQKSANIRGDVENEFMLNNVTTATVHEACYKKYTNPKLALAARYVNSCDNVYLIFLTMLEIHVKNRLTFFMT